MARFEPIAIVGMGCVYPNGFSPDQYWETLLKADSSAQGLPPNDRWDYRSFHSDEPHPDKGYSALGGYIRDFGAAPPLPVSRSRWQATPFAERWLLSALGQCRDEVGKVKGRQLCVMGSTAVSGSEAADWAARRFLDELEARLGPAEAAALRRSSARFLEQHRAGSGATTSPVSHPTVLRRAVRTLLGPGIRSFVIDAACASSLFAIDHGLRALREGSVDVAWCGGFFAWGPVGQVLFSKLNGLSRTQCAPFARSADGTLFGDGAGVVALQRLSDARRAGRTIHALILGTGTASDGQGRAIYAPNSRGQIAAMSAAFADADVDVDSIGYVCAHATGTPVGDAVEYESLLGVYGSRSRGPGTVALGSTKGLFGHLGWAAGVASVMQVTLALRNLTVPPQANYSEPGIRLEDGPFFINREPRAFPARASTPARAAVSGFGFGGTNAHLILERWEPKSERASVQVPLLLPSPNTCPFVVVAWSAALPGASGQTAVRNLVSSNAPIPQRFAEKETPTRLGRFRMVPSAIRVTDPSQLHLLPVVEEALSTLQRALPELRDSCAVIAAQAGPLADSVDVCERIHRDLFRKTLSDLCQAHPGIATALDQYCDELSQRVPPPNEDSFPGIMPNVVAGRLSNTFDLRGINQTIDCDDLSLQVATRTALELLAHRRTDLALVVAASRAAPGTPVATCREAALCVAIMREADAARHQLQVLAEIRLPGLEELPSCEDPTVLDEGLPRGMAGLGNLLKVLAGCESAARVGSGDAFVITRPGGRLEEPRRPEVALFESTMRLEPRLNENVTTASLEGWQLVATTARATAELARVLTQEVFTFEAEAPREGPIVESAGSNRRLLIVLDLRHVGDDPLPARLHAAWLEAVVWCHRCQVGRATATLVVVGLHESEPGSTPHPVLGLFQGLARSWPKEYAQARVRVLALGQALDSTLPRRVHALLAANHELASEGRDGRLWVNELVPVPQILPEETASLSRGDVLVGLGCTSGIGGELALEWAIRSGCQVVLAGREEPKPDPYWPDRLPERAVFLRDGNPSGARGIRDRVALYEDLLRRRNRFVLLRRFLANGIPVHWIRCDATSEEQVRHLFHVVAEQFGGVDAALLAAVDIDAGVTGLHRLDWARYIGLGPKIFGARHVARLDLPAETRVVNLGSVAALGLTGMPGYVDANAFLDHLSRWMHSRGHRWHTQGWPAWAEVGLTSRNDSLLRRLSERGRSLLLSTTQARSLAATLDDPRAPPVMYLLHPKDVSATEADRSTERTQATMESRFPFIDAITRKSATDLRARRELSTTRDPWLSDHRFSGVPVLPATCLLELAAEVATELVGPGPAIICLRDAVFHRFVKVFPGRSLTLHVVARRASPSADVVGVHVYTRRHLSTSPASPALRLHFSAYVEFGDPPVACEVPSEVVGHRYALPDPYGFPNSALEIRGCFESTVGQAGNAQGAEAVYRRPVAPSNRPFGETLLAPLLLDGALRAAALVALRDGSLPVLVPLSVGRVEVFQQGSDAELGARREDLLVQYRAELQGNPYPLWEVWGRESGLVYRIHGVLTRQVDVVTPTYDVALPHFADRIVARGPNWLIAERDLDLERDPHLRTAARLDGTPVLGGSFQMEMASEIAELLRPGLALSRIEDIRFHEVLKLRTDRPRTTRIEVEELEARDGVSLIRCSVCSKHVTPKGVELRRVLHSTMNIRLEAKGKSRATFVPEFAVARAVPEVGIPACLYYRRAPLRLGVGYCSVWDTHRSGDCLRATYHNANVPRGRGFESHRLPALLLDGALQCCLERNAAFVEMGIPKSIAVIRVMKEFNEFDVHEWGPLDIFTDRAPDGAWRVAVETRESERLLEVEGFEAYPLGRINLLDGHLERDDRSKPPAEFFRVVPTWREVSTPVAWRSNPGVVSATRIIGLDASSRDELASSATDLATVDSDAKWIEGHLDATAALLTSASTSEAIQGVLDALYDLGRLAIDARQACLIVVRNAWSARGLLHPIAHAVVGFTKALARELGFDRVRCLVLDATVVARAHVSCRELGFHALPGRPAVFVRDNRLLEECFVRATIVPTRLFTFRTGEVVVITGGTGALGFATARALARRFGVRCILVGRTPPAEAGEALPPLQAFLTERRDEGVVARLREHTHLAQRIKVRQCLAELEQEGAVVHFRQCDVADRSAVAELIRELRETFGAVVGVVHAAGTQHSALLQNKRRADFQQVTRVKVQGAINLYHALAEHPPRVWLNFGSGVVAGGVDGLTDYCAANHFLAGFSEMLHATGRVQLARTIHWPAWAESGMATKQNSLLSGLSDRGMPPVYPDRGEELLLAELTHAPSEQANSMYFTADFAHVAGLSSQVSEIHPPSPWAKLDAVDPDGALHFQSRVLLSPERFPELRHHPVDGVPALTGAGELALALETLRARFGALYIHRCEGIDYRSFVKVPVDASRWVGVEVEVLPSDSPWLRCRVDIVAEVNHRRSGRLLKQKELYWGAVITLGTTPPKASPRKLRLPTELVELPVAHYRSGARIRYDAAWQSLEARWKDARGDLWGRVGTKARGATFDTLGDALALTPAILRGSRTIVHVNVRTERLEFFAPVRLGTNDFPNEVFTHAKQMESERPEERVCSHLALFTAAGELMMEAETATFVPYDTESRDREESEVTCGSV